MSRRANLAPESAKTVPPAAGRSILRHRNNYEVTSWQLQLKTDGPFRTGRKWYSQFFTTPEGAWEVQDEINDVHYTQGMAKPEDAQVNIDDGLPF